jgi:predicted metal-dependent hydrolase
MVTSLKLGDIAVEVVYQPIKNVHLSVYPPAGRVRMAAPERMDLEALRLYAISKLPWIKRQRRRMQEQEREAPREYLERESHYVWGKRYLLSVVEENAPPSVELGPSRLTLHIRPRSDRSKRRDVLQNWYREQVRMAAEPLLARWERKIGVKSSGLFVRRMKTRWGSCNPVAKTVWLNTELACKPPRCLEYILVHELVHLLEPSHNERFQAYMQQFLPDWKLRRQELNRLPVRHEDWGY